MKNPFSKTRKIHEPYAIYMMAGWEWRILKTYQRPDKEKNNSYARWLFATKSPHTNGDFEIGDGYSRPILETPQISLSKCSPEWRKHYPEKTQLENKLIVIGCSEKKNKQIKDKLISKYLETEKERRLAQIFEDLN
tara:strand:+ start:957 stop:1364 length:408 start_codon:yes stop_codon:yes gene_type:complete